MIYIKGLLYHLICLVDLLANKAVSKTIYCEYFFPLLVNFKVIGLQPCKSENRVLLAEIWNN